ncbi:hypothetical protein [Alkalihalobacillus trypoxylicola]|uniref:SAM-dependent methyltransferase n=1 Tax=Alkalihalobacillus trypoxylicola TaxID=519424 RepID=A0A162CMV7_9BACI|nr:hypothetical protein [Alkalihalobacillus trypoxylicola]KYG25600.1 SAM-dependent methyltransferase [Alkalihalobacillus trypoxylicola]
MRKDEAGRKLNLDRIVFIGRTYEEYLKIFSLSIDDLKGKRVLDCPAGACSFTAIAKQLGVNATAGDIAYSFSAEELETKGLNDISHVTEHMKKKPRNYRWDYFKDLEALKQYRIKALKEFIKDLQINRESYIPVTLPSLPFKDEQFDITLSAHFLFMYSDKLDFAFHPKVIDELLRVSTAEVRIFPLVDSIGNRPPFLKRLMDTIQKQGWKVEELAVPYEFQKNANTMLKIYK